MIDRATLWVLTHVWKREEGQTAAEYAVILALILVVAIGAIELVGGGVKDTFNSVAGKL
jgi:pilus assembly protein Flp/PilA